MLDQDKVVNIVGHETIITHIGQLVEEMKMDKQLKVMMKYNASRKIIEPPFSINMTGIAIHRTFTARINSVCTVVVTHSKWILVPLRQKIISLHKKWFNL